MRRRRWAQTALLCLLAAAAACFSRTHFIDDVGLCVGVDCSGHGQCQTRDGAAVCDCDSGFRPEGHACVTSPAGGLAASFASASLKVRQDAALGDSPSWQINAARNEFEPFQLVLRSDEELDGVDVSISDFIGDGGRISQDNVTIFLVRYLTITTPSTNEGEVGEWPDILVPKVDAYYREARSSFPFTLPATRLQPIWFDLFVPEDTTPGDYLATVTVSRAGATQFQGSVSLHVWRFALPATASLATQFGLGGNYLGHYGDIWSQPDSLLGSTPMHAIKTLTQTYLRAGLRHRLSLTPMSVAFNAWDGSSYAEVNATWFMASIAGLIGDGDTSVEYGDAELTSLQDTCGMVFAAEVTKAGGCSACVVPPPEFIARCAQRAATFASLLTPAEKQVFSLMPIGSLGEGGGCGDENRPLDYAAVRAAAREIRNAGLKVSIAMQRVPELLDQSVTPARNDLIDIWQVPFQFINGNSWEGAVDTRREYDADIAAGAQLWWFQNCMAHGCGVVGGDLLKGYPQYLVDFPATYNRVFPWMAFAFDVQGETYHGTTVSYTLGADGTASGDPWYSLMTVYGGNGDGTLFYPGVPDVVAAGLPNEGRGAHTPSIGGVHPIPIESIRLKMIREGHEDYEYLHLLSALGEDAFAKAQAARIVTTTFEFEHDPEVFSRVRDELASRLEQHFR